MHIQYTCNTHIQLVTEARVIHDHIYSGGSDLQFLGSSSLVALSRIVQSNGSSIIDTNYLNVPCKVLHEINSYMVTGYKYRRPSFLVNVYIVVSPIKPRTTSDMYFCETVVQYDWPSHGDFGQKYQVHNVS
jgi:hypothetical protein